MYLYPVGSGYAMTQGPDVAPVAYQMQLSGGPQAGQPETLHGTMTSGYQYQRIDLPPSYEERQYMTQQNQQV